jgi:hypothetical protein
MAYSVVVVTPPATEVLTLEEAKKHLRVVDDNDDDYISDLITASRQLAEIYLDRTLITTTLRMRADSFPDLPNATLKFFVPTYSVESYLARAISLMSGPFRLLRPPVQSVTGITYIDANGNLQTLSPSAYIVDYDAEPARIAPAYSTPWPVTQAVQGAVNVTYKAGYGDAPSAVPIMHKQALRLLVSHFYENREVVTASMATKVPLSVEALLDADSVPEYD